MLKQKGGKARLELQIFLEYRKSRFFPLDFFSAIVNGYVNDDVSEWWRRRR